MPKFIGPVPVPNDKPLGEFIESLMKRDSVFLKTKQVELGNTIEQTLEKDEPLSFAYAKLLNFLNKGIEFDELVHLCASSMWRLFELSQEDEDGST